MTDPLEDIEPPTETELLAIADWFGFDLDRADIDAISTVIKTSVDSFRSIPNTAPDCTSDAQPDSRTVTTSPGDATDPYNAWVTRCEVCRDTAGALDGMSVGLKDNIALADIPMTCGSRLFIGYVPNSDATVVHRLLDAGGRITGKLNMPAFAMSASGYLCDFGAAVLNPHDSSYLAGGSSSGAAVAVVTDDVDIAIGTDQGGSIRIPAAWCGCVGHKPTYGLVPYTGIASTGPTVDHAGPLTSTVGDAKIVLDILAGHDGKDPRQGSLDLDTYRQSFSADLSDCTIGIVTEAFGTEYSDTDVDEAVRETVATLDAVVNEVRDVSVPIHSYGKAIREAVSVGETVALVRDDGIGRYLRGRYDEEYAAAFSTARDRHSDQFPVTLQVKMLLGEYLSREYQGRLYARAQNRRLQLAAAYDDCLAAVDVLVMPTTPMTALEAEDDISQRDVLTNYDGINVNTAPFNLTGHPAVSVPCGKVDGLPIGLMIVGGRFADGFVLRVAEAVEALNDGG